MLEKLFVLFLCHVVGDYVLQSDFIAKTKGENWWHLIVHCTLYLLPFYIAFGFRWMLLVTFAIHMMTDAFKARYKMIGYVEDQAIHMINLMMWTV